MPRAPAAHAARTPIPPQCSSAWGPHPTPTQPLRRGTVRAPPAAGTLLRARTELLLLGRGSWPGTRGAGGTRWQRVGPYGFMLKKSLMPSGLTGLLLLFFSATDFSLVQVRCTFSGAVSASSPGVELLEKVVAFLSWMSWTCGEQRVTVGRSRGQTPARAASWQSPSPPPPASPRRRPPAPQGRSGAGACWPGSCAGWSRGTRP